MNKAGKFLISKVKKRKPKITERLSVEEIGEYKQAFLLYDRHDSGAINKNELLDVMRSLGQNPTEEEVQEIIDDTNAKKNGKILFEKFLEKMAERSEKVDREEDLRNAFRVFDADGDGQISLDELRDVMLNLGDPLTYQEVNELMSEADKDQNGFIDFEDHQGRIALLHQFVQGY